MQELDLQLYKSKHEPGHLLDGGRPIMATVTEAQPKRPERPQIDEQPPAPTTPPKHKPGQPRRHGGGSGTGLQVARVTTYAPPRLKPDPDFIRQLGVLAVKGFTDKEIADVYGVTVKVVRRWAQQYPDFMATLTNAREMADDAVERALFARATGYSVPEVIVNVGKDGDVTKVDSIKHYPPDVNAAQYWLKNRRGDKWRDRQEVELSGKDGKPLAVVLFAPQMAAGQQAGGTGAGGSMGGQQQLGPTDSRDIIIEATGQDGDGRFGWASEAAAIIGRPPSNRCPGSCLVLYSCRSNSCIMDSLQDWPWVSIPLCKSHKGIYLKDLRGFNSGKGGGGK